MAGGEMLLDPLLLYRGEFAVDEGVELSGINMAG